jgi:glyoxylase-like metal-dependent hydrolase (beta-lactamase superfamily II)
VDTTTGSGADALIAAAERAGGSSPRSALTHGHADHVGSLDALNERLRDSAQVLMPAADVRIHASDFYGRFPCAAMASWGKAAVVECARRLRSLDPAVLPAGTGLRRGIRGRRWIARIARSDAPPICAGGLHHG